MKQLPAMFHGHPTSNTGPGLTARLRKMIVGRLATFLFHQTCQVPKMEASSPIYIYIYMLFFSGLWIRESPSPKQPESKKSPTGPTFHGPLTLSI